MQFRDILLEQKKVDSRFKKVTPLIPAVTCDVSGNTEDANGDPISSAVDEEPNKIWVRTFNDAVPQSVLNDNVVPVQSGLTVLIGYLEGSPEIEVVRLNRSAIVETTGILDHSAFGETYTSVLRRQLAPLKVTPSGTAMVVSIAQLEYDRTGSRAFFITTTLDLASSVPSSGFKRYTLVYLDVANAAIAIVDGTIVADLPSKIPVKPNTPIDGIPSVYVLLAGGATLLVEDDIEAAQRILLPNSIPGVTSDTIYGNLEIPANYTAVRGNLKIPGGKTIKILNTGRIVSL